MLRRGPGRGVDRTKTRAELLDAFGRDGCPACRLVIRHVAAYLEAVSVEGGMTVPVGPAWERAMGMTVRTFPPIPGLPRL